jgi:glycosyltransferase involved in cell wall biosynthesis
MKIGILGTRGIPNHYGGFEQFAQWLSRGLVEKGHEVFVYNSSNHPYQEKSWNGVHIIHCKDREHKIGTAGQFLYDLRCNRDAARRNFDVLFHFGYSSDSCWWRQWPKNTRNIVNMDGLEWKRTKYNRLTRGFLKKAEGWAARHAHGLIADSPAIRDYLWKTYGKTPVFIPYGADLFTGKDPTILNQYGLTPGQYYLLVARMEPENNIEMIIAGWLASEKKQPLVIVGSTRNQYGKTVEKKYAGPSLKFLDAIYDQGILNNLRCFSTIYFHGHSVGGTNPSLLEAMSCGCFIAAHDNIFNRAVVGEQGLYFSSPGDIAVIMNDPPGESTRDRAISLNFEKIRTTYDPARIINAYEELMLNL